MHYIYILTNKSNSTLYIGTTRDLEYRINQHKEKNSYGFSAKYNLNKLVYYEEFDLAVDAIQREKQLKKWKRKWKNELINTMNISWKDISEEWKEI